MVKSSFISHPGGIDIRFEKGYCEPNAILTYFKEVMRKNECLVTRKTRNARQNGRSRSRRILHTLSRPARQHRCRPGRVDTCMRDGLHLHPNGRLYAVFIGHAAENAHGSELHSPAQNTGQVDRAKRIAETHFRVFANVKKCSAGFFRQSILLFYNRSVFLISPRRRLSSPAR